MSREALERAVLDAVAVALDPAVLEAAIDRAMELVEERREATVGNDGPRSRKRSEASAPRKAD